MSNWTEICALNDIHPNTGVCALVADTQVAVFRHQDNVYAVSNYDPIGSANVLSRGLLAQIGDELTVASPLYKQHFSLTTGACIEEDASISVFKTKLENDTVYVSAN